MHYEIEWISLCKLTDKSTGTLSQTKNQKALKSFILKGFSYELARRLELLTCWLRISYPDAVSTLQSSEIVKPIAFSQIFNFQPCSIFDYLLPFFYWITDKFTDTSLRKHTKDCLYDGQWILVHSTMTVWHYIWNCLASTVWPLKKTKLIDFFLWKQRF